MLFQSQAFLLLFLPISFLSYYAQRHSAATRQWVLIAASLFFYSWWDIRFTPLLVAQIGITWGLAHLHERVRAVWPLYVGIAVNLTTLCTFKYLAFLLSIVADIIGAPAPRLSLILPIGISFFTFQLISYLVDRMRDDAPIYSARHFLLFVLLFPHLIAGPIVRHNEIIPQFDRDPFANGLAKPLGIGCTLIAIGLVKKVLVSDRIADMVNSLFSLAAHRPLSFGESWTATLGFSFQIFLDFSAYTEMAIGIALLFGLVLPENFSRPYMATDIAEFWRRWHMSLSRFLRDYLYIPLGGSREGVVKLIYATLATMALCGLWHGAGWTYVIWGLWHGIALLVHRAWKSVSMPLPAPLGWLLTMAFVMIGWVIFRAPDLGVATSILVSMTGFNGVTGALGRPDVMAECLLACIVVPPAHQLMNGFKPYPAIAAVAAIVGAYCVLYVGKGAPAEFIYFQF